MNNELLTLIDNIDVCVQEAEMDVIYSMQNEYEKLCEMAEYCDDAETAVCVMEGIDMTKLKAVGSKMKTHAKIIKEKSVKVIKAVINAIIKAITAIINKITGKGNVKGDKTPNQVLDEMGVEGNSSAETIDISVPLADSSENLVIHAIPSDIYMQKNGDSIAFKGYAKSTFKSIIRNSGINKGNTNKDKRFSVGGPPVHILYYFFQRDSEFNQLIDKYDDILKAYNNTIKDKTFDDKLLEDICEKIISLNLEVNDFASGYVWQMGDMYGSDTKSARKVLKNFKQYEKDHAINVESLEKMRTTLAHVSEVLSSNNQDNKLTQDDYQVKDVDKESVAADWLNEIPDYIININNVLYKTMTTVQFAINFIDPLSNSDRCFIDSRFAKSIDNIDTLSELAVQLIHAKLPTKDVLKTLWFVASENIRGGNKYKPIWGQTRAIFMPTDKPSDILKIALAPNGLSDNTREVEITKRCDAKLDKSDIIITRVTHTYSGGAINEMERAYGIKKWNMNKEIKGGVMSLQMSLGGIEFNDKEFNEKLGKLVDILGKPLTDLHNSNIGFRKEAKDGKYSFGINEPVIVDYAT